MRRILPFLKVMQAAGLPGNLVRDAEEELESPQEGLNYLEPTHDDPDAFERLYYSPVELQHNAKKARAKAAKWKRFRLITLAAAIVLAVFVFLCGYTIYHMSGITVVGDAETVINTLEEKMQ